VVVILFILINFLLIFHKTIALTGYKKFLLFLSSLLIYSTFYILFIHKFTYSKFEESSLFSFEIIFLSIFTVNILFFYCILSLILWDMKNYNDIRRIFVKQIKGINIIDYELPPEFYNLSEKEKYASIFKKQNIKHYNYKLNDNQINLINNINDIRKQYNLSTYKYSKIEKLPEFLINEKTELNFYRNENIYKLNEELFIFKYSKNKFQKFLNNKELLNIITNDLLNKIYIIEQNNLEFTCFYNRDISKKSINWKRFKEESKPENIHLNIHSNRININIIDNYIANTEDKLKDKSDNLNVTEISDDEENENKIIRNIKINKNVFEK